MQKVLLIVPAYNEEESIGSTLSDLSRFINTHQQSLGFNLDIVVVNDGSKDSTATIVRKQGVDLIDLPTNLGLTGAFMAGMKYAKRHDYDAAIQFDADGQHRPEFIPDLVCAAGIGGNQPVDIVIGSRFLIHKKGHSLRMLGNSLISFTMRLTTRHTITDPTSGMRLFSRRVIDFYVHHTNMSPEPETISFLLKKGFSLKEVQVSIADRTAGKSYLSLHRSISYMVRVAVSILVFQPFRK